MKVSNKEIIKVFLKLGTFAFGGPAAHIAMMEEEIVEKRAWLSNEKFLDIMGLTNLIPGPNSTEMAIFIGHEVGGKLGLLLAGFFFITPAVLISLGFAIFYYHYQSLPQVVSFMDGIKPVIIAIIFQALLRLVPSVLKDWEGILVFIVAVILSLFSISEITVLLLATSLYIVIKSLKESKIKITVVEPISILLIFLIFLKIGSVLYGSGYVLLSFLETEFVVNRSLLTTQQLIDATALGQMKPGPVFTTATFLGYQMRQLPGAIAATLGIFTPSFVLVLILYPFLEKMRASKFLNKILQGLSIASLSLMAVVLYTLAKTSIVSISTGLIFVLSFVVMRMYKLNSAWLILAGGIIGLILYR